MFTQTEALAKIADLITRFEEQLPSYKKSEYTISRACYFQARVKAGADTD